MQAVLNKVVRQNFLLADFTNYIELPEWTQQTILCFTYYFNRLKPRTPPTPPVERKPGINSIPWS